MGSKLVLEISEEERKRLRKDFDKHIADFEKSWKAYMVEHPSKTIIFSQATYDADFEDTQKCVERVGPHTDYTIIAEDGTLSDQQRDWLKQHGCLIKTFEFQDNLPEMRNQYLEEAKGIDPYAWILVSDPDELMSKSLCQDLRKIVEALQERGYNMAGINCHEYFAGVEQMDEGELMKEVPGGYRESSFWKNLLFKLTPDLRYEGVGRGKNVHETWFSPTVPFRSVNLHKHYFYEHRKSAAQIWRNAARNFFIGGCGDNLLDLNPAWVELRKVTDFLGINNWRQFEAYLKKGNIDKKLRDFIIAHRNDSEFEWQSEHRELFKWYFYMLHPEENVEGYKSEYTPPPEGSLGNVEQWVIRCYHKILGRHPDERGKKSYTQLILAGKVKKEQLPAILRSSPEWREKFGYR